MWLPQPENESAIAKILKLTLPLPLPTGVNWQNQLMQNVPIAKLMKWNDRMQDARQLDLWPCLPAKFPPASRRGWSPQVDKRGRTSRPLHHLAVYVDHDEQSAEQDGTNEGTLQAKVEDSASNGEGSKVWMSSTNEANETEICNIKQKLLHLFPLTLTTPNPPKPSKGHFCGIIQHCWKLVLSPLQMGQNYYLTRS